ncbi:hypothetical protein FACS189491_06580 [Spirochaetia bacterium]|nr:hypothetical protein FACS189491_06580 [Spirochaetia bacterium]
MEKRKLDLLSHVFTELTEEKQEDILKVSKRLLKVQKVSKTLIDIEGVSLSPVEEKKAE